jgi:hypothetical protein
MYEGKERRIELIRELRAAGDDTEATAEDLNRPTTDERKTKVRDAAIDSIAGETTSALLDFFAKDLVRKEEKDRLEAIAKAADAERRKREVAEGGTRQAQELVRDREDEAYRQVMRMNNAAATSYVQSVMDAAIDKVVQDVIAKMLRGDGALVGRLMQSGDDDMDLAVSFLVAGAEAVGDDARDAEDGARFTDAAQASLKVATEDVSLRSTR